MDSKTADLVQSMTLEEKASLCSGLDGWNTKSLPQKGVPSLRMCDGPSGLRFQTEEDDHIGVHASAEMVSYPTGCAMASSFDRRLMERVGAAIGEEARSVGVNVVLGPAVNIKRTPLCGRNFEYLSEDPFLTGEMAAAEIRGIQSKNVGACMKHYACNNQETWRMKIDARVDERTLREIYLAGFERAIKQEQPCAVMASYNRVNGLPATENPHLLTEVLRDEWGFKGVVVSDWGATNDRAASLAAGMDLEMPGSSGITDRQLVKAVKSGKLKERVLDTAVERCVEQMRRYAAEPEGVDFDREAHHALAVEAAEGAAVLLKNEKELLPLKSGQKVVLIGRFAERPRFQGGGSACVNPFRLTNALAELEKVEGISYFPGFTELDDQENELWKQQAVRAAAQAQVAVIFAGLPETFESECYDRVDMKLPACQNDVIQAVCDVQKNVVVVVYSGSPVEMPWADRVGAILQMHTGGQGVGSATANLLYGRANPSGKLAETYPLCLEDNPSYLSYPGDGETVWYQEGIFVGYRYYDKKKRPVLFPFGHGLSYTTFRYENLCLDCTQVSDDGQVRVSVDVTNTGKVFGQEVVQLYVEDRTEEQQTDWHVDQKAQVAISAAGKSAARPEKELKGFEKIALDPGERKTVTFMLDRRSFAWYDAGRGEWRCNPGEYRIHVGASSRDLRAWADVKMQVQAAPCVKSFAMDTLMSEIAQDPQQWEMTLRYLSEVCPKLNEIIHGEDENSLYLREELKELPLYAVRGIYSVQQEALDQLIEMLNQKQC